MTKKELVKLLVENFKDEVGNLDLSGLDFTKEDIKGVVISKMKVNGHLFQEKRKVQGDLWQAEQEVSGSLHQEMQRVKGDLEQGGQEVGGDLYQGYQKVGRNLYQLPQRGRGNWTNYHI